MAVRKVPMDELIDKTSAEEHVIRGSNVAMVRHAINRHGGIHKLPDAPEGPILLAFEPHELARIIRQEVTRAYHNGFPRVSMHMGLDDALVLAAYLDLR